MSDPVTPTDDLLSKLANGDPYLIIALRQLFDQAGTLSPDLINAALIAAGNAEGKANQANAAIKSLTSAIELLALKPEDERLIERDNLLPVNLPIKLDDDLAPRFEIDPTLLKASDIGDTVQAHSSNLDSINQDLGTGDDAVFNTVQSSNSKFLANKTSSSANVTGDGTAYTVIFNSEIYDVGSDYDVSTGVYTAPTTGKYSFKVGVQINPVGAATTIDCQLVATSRAIRLDFEATPSNDRIYLSGATDIDMTAGDTVKVVVTGSGTTKTLDVEGNASSLMISYFGGGIKT